MDFYKRPSASRHLASIILHPLIKSTLFPHLNECYNSTQEVEAMAIITHYGESRDLSCTEKEREIYDIIRSVCDDDNLDSDNLALIRKSDNYVSAVMPSSQGYGDMDLARIKFTDRAKWIQLAPDFKKIKIRDPEDVAEMAEDIRAAYRFNEPYL